MAIANFRVRVFKNVAELEFFIKTAIAAGVLTSGDHTFNFTFPANYTLVIEGSNDGGETFFAFKRTFIASALGPHINIAAVLAEINTAARWDGGVLPSEFVITANANKLVITHAQLGDAFALRIRTESSELSGATNSTLQFVAGVKAKGNKGSLDLQSVVDITPDDHGNLILSYLVT